MATSFSDQLTNLEKTTPAVYAKPADLAGRVRVAYFTYTTPTGGQAINDFIFLTKVPTNARILSAGFVWGAMTTVGATASFGTADDTLGTNAVATFGAAIAVAAAGSQNVTPLALDNLPNSTPYANVKYIYAQATGAAWVAGVKLQGFALYVLD